jgi:predicted transport protein
MEYKIEINVAFRPSDGQIAYKIQINVLSMLHGQMEYKIEINMPFQSRDGQMAYKIQINVLSCYIGQMECKIEINMPFQSCPMRSSFIVYIMWSFSPHLILQNGCGL